VRARAGKLAWGEQGTNACPAGSSAITDVAQCQAAAKTAGKNWYGSSKDAGSPRWCSWLTNVKMVYFNTHPTGAANQYGQPLCAVSTGT
jgi:hypothetical protein